MYMCIYIYIRAILGFYLGTIRVILGLLYIYLYNVYIMWFWVEWFGAEQSRV